MTQIGTPAHTGARVVFVRLLTDAKAAFRLRNGGGDGPNKLLAQNMKVAPKRLNEFLNDGFLLKPKEVRHLKTTVRGFAESVERSLGWLKAQGGIAKKLNTKSIVRGYWPEESAKAFEVTAVQQAIREGIIKAKKGIEKEKYNNATLKIIEWGPFQDSFFMHYGRALFRGIDSQQTPQVIRTQAANRLDLPLRSGEGNWVVAMGPYKFLERRFRGLDFITFPALRYPLLGLVLSQVNIPDRIEFVLEPLLDKAPHLTSLLDKNIQMPRFVADDAARTVLYSMFNSNEEAEALTSGQITRLKENNPASIARRLRNELEERPPLIAILADPILAFQIFCNLMAENNNIDIRVITEKKPYINFAFAAGIMFREEDHNLAHLIERSQQQIFRSPARVGGLLEALLHELDDWVYDLQIPERVITKWKTPIVLYSHYEVENYIANSFVPTMLKTVEPSNTAGLIFNHIDDLLSKSENPATLLTEDSPPFKNPVALRTLFGSTNPAARTRIQKDRGGLS
jgi:hypothetical protein